MLLPQPSAARSARRWASPKPSIEAASSGASTAAAGVASFTVDPGLSDDDFARVDLRLDGPAGADWDIAVFDESGETVAAGASRRSSEAATGLRAGSAGRAHDSGVPCLRGRQRGDGRRWRRRRSTRRQRPQVLAGARRDAEPRATSRLLTHARPRPDRARRRGLRCRRPARRQGPRRARQGGPRLRGRSRRPRPPERRPARRARSDTPPGQRQLGLPSGRTTYRHLFEFNQEMKDLADGQSRRSCARSRSTT